MNKHIFDPDKRKRLNNPERLRWMPPYKIWDFVQPNNAKVVVDIGAGTGYITKALAMYYPATVFLALDIEPIMVEEMNQSLVPNANVIPKLIEPYKIPLQDDFADMVMGINVYHEFDDAKKMLKEIHRVLRPHGKLLIVDWDKSHESCEQGPIFEHRISKEDAVKDLASVNFHTIKTTTDFQYHYAISASKS